MKAAVLYEANTPLQIVDLEQQGALVSRTYKIEEINEGFTAMRTGQVARGVVVFS
jgi:hypothetical protein